MWDHRRKDERLQVHLDSDLDLGNHSVSSDSDREDGLSGE